MTYTVEFLDHDSAEPYREFYETYAPEIISRQVNEEGKISSLHCLITSNHSHNDKQTSAYVYLKSGVFGCSVCGNYSPYNFLTQVIGTSRAEAGSILSEYTMSQKFPKNDNFSKGYAYPSATLTEYSRLAQKNLGPDLPIVKDYCDQRGLTYTTLVELGVGYVAETPLQSECLVFPYYSNGKVVALRGRTSDGRKGGVRGSQFIPYNLDSTDGHTTVLLCEGESDTARVTQAVKNLGLKLGVVGSPGAQFRREWVREFAGVDVIYVIPQADQPSYAFAEKTQDILGKDRVKIIELPWKRGEIGKDICDWLNIHTEAEFKDLVPDEVTRQIVFLTHNEMLALADQEVPWIIQNLIAQGDKVLLGGEQKSLKTFLTLYLTRDLVLGQNLFGQSHFLIPSPKNVLFVEEEGSPIHFARRIKRIMDFPDLDNVRWLHRQTVKLDVAPNLERLFPLIEEFRPDLLVLDPFQRLHNATEDVSWEMGKIWDTLHGLTNRYPGTALFIIHHFKKGGAANGGAGWDSFRGSSRSGGEADTGIFVSRARDLSEAGEIHLTVRVDGRDIPPIREGGNNGEFDIYIDPDSWTLRFGDSFQVNVPGRSSPQEASVVDYPEEQDEDTGVFLRLLLQPRSHEELQLIMGYGEGRVRRILRSLGERIIRTTQMYINSAGAEATRYLYHIESLEN